MPNSNGFQSLRSNLLWRVWGGLSILVIISISLLGLVSAQQIGNDTREAIEDALQSQLLILNQLFAAQVVARQADQSTAIDLSEIPDRVTLIGLDGSVVADNRELASLMDNHLNRPEIVAIESQANRFGSTTRRSETLDLDMLYVATDLRIGGEKVGYVRISRPLSAVDEKVGQFRESTAVLAGLLILATLFAGLIFAQQISSPLFEMRRISTRMADGEFDLRIPEGRADEFGELAGAINQLGGAIEKRLRDLTRNRNELEAILGGLEEGVIAIDRKQRVIHINSVAETLLGMSIDPRAKVNLLQLQVDAQLRELVSAFLAESTNQFRNIKMLGKTVATSVLRSGGPSFEGAIIVLQDITEVRRLERARTDFVANASHELKTPIAALKGFIDTLVEDKSMPADTASHFLSRSAAQVSRLQGVVTDLLQLSRLESRDEDRALLRVNLIELLRAVFTDKLQDAHLADIALEIALPDESVEVLGENESLEQLFTNLIDNAIKYSPSGSVVRVVAELSDSSIKIQVIDQGIGIPDKEQARIFERFYRVDRARSREKGGTGLGLSIVKHISELHGGKVAVESVEGKGSTFIVTLPIAYSQGDLAL
ncbi:MAG: ATP-binding protein [Pseudomonadota bacterium]|nr:ATP-binding protein [Pseudomonadota bacterium]